MAMRHNLNIKWFWRVAGYLALASAFLALTPIAVRADITYTYTGNPFANFVGLACPPDCNIQVTLTLPQPLPPNLNCTASNIGACFIIPKSFSITDGLFVITQAGPFQGGAAFPECFFLTDASGTITGWAVVANGLNWVIGTTNAPQLGFTTTDTIDSVGTGPTYFAFNTNSPGTWTRTGQGAARLSLLSGNSQTGAALTVLPNSLVVQTTDLGGSPLAGIPISFAIRQQPAGAAGAALTAATATTNSNGTASTQLTLGNLRGQYQVTARCSGTQTCTPSNVVFTETENAQVITLALDLYNTPPSLVFPGGTKNNRMVKATATVTDQSGQPVQTAEQADFSVRPDAVGMRNAGHCHSNSNTLSGFLVLVDDSGSPSSSCMTGTDGPGTCHVQWIVDDDSGSFNIQASLHSDPAILDNKAVTVSLNTLQSLAPITPHDPCTADSGSGPGFVLVGQFGTGSVTSQHYQNHFGTPTLVGDVVQLASQYFAKTGKTLQLNDMSLPQGGLFDIGNDWLAPHFLHRDGNSVDFNKSHIDGSPVDRNLLTRLAKKLGMCPATEPLIHFDLEITGCLTR